MTSIRTVPALRTSHTDPTLWAATAALAVLTLAGMAWMGWAVLWPAVVLTVVAVGLLAGIGAYYQSRADDLARFAYATALSIAMGVTCQGITYVLATTHAPLRTAELTALDAALGFSWPVWKAWVVSHPRVATLFGLVYPQHVTASAVTVGVLALRTTDGATRFLRAFTLAFLATCVGLLTVPALTNTPAAPSNVARLALRDGTFTPAGTGHSHGLVSMPSMHAALAVLSCLALWRFRAWRIPLALFTGVMLAATPSEGGHYLVDVLAGVAVALVAWRRG
jgi:hypothetical protein